MARLSLAWNSKDLYVEALDPSDPHRYKTETGWDTMNVEKATFHIKGEADRVVELKSAWTRPLGRRAHPSRTGSGVRLSDPGTAGYLGGLTMDRVKNWN